MHIEIPFHIKTSWHLFFVYSGYTVQRLMQQLYAVQRRRSCTQYSGAAAVHSIAAQQLHTVLRSSRCIQYSDAAAVYGIGAQLSTIARQLYTVTQQLYTVAAQLLHIHYSSAAAEYRSGATATYSCKQLRCSSCAVPISNSLIVNFLRLVN